MLFFQHLFVFLQLCGKLPGTPFPPSLKVDGNGHFQPFLREQKWVHHPIETTMKKMDGHQVPGGLGPDGLDFWDLGIFPIRGHQSTNLPVVEENHQLDFFVENLTSLEKQPIPLSHQF